MPKITVTEYNSLAKDVNNEIVMCGSGPRASQVLTAFGNAVALADETRFVRVATDTAIHIKQGAGAATSDPWMPANAVEFFAVHEGTVLSFIQG